MISILSSYIELLSKSFKFGKVSVVGKMINAFLEPARVLNIF